MQSRALSDDNSNDAPEVVLVTGSLMGGGAERVMADMANYWAGSGWRITLVTWTGKEIEDFYTLDSSVRRVWIDSQPPPRSLLGQIRSNVSRACKLRHLLRHEKPDAILSFIDTSNVRTIVSALGLNLRVIISERTNPGYSYGIPWQWRILRRKLYRYAAIIVAQTSDAARWIEEECGVNVKVISNPLRSLPKIVSKREFTILAVGRLSHEKGFDLLIRAFAKTRRELPEWKVVIVGAGPDQAKLQTLCSKMNLGESVEFHEPVTDIEAWMSRASLVVQPSRFEGFPNVVLEAMGMGATVISADCHSGPGEIIEDRVNGWLVPVEDVDALRSAMIELMSQPDTRERLGKEAVKVRQSFGQDKVMAQWNACIRGAEANEIQEFA